MNLEKLAELLSDDSKVETYDITTKEGYNEFKKSIDSLRNSNTTLFDLAGVDMDEWLNNVENLGSKIYNESQKKKLKESFNNKESILKNAAKQMCRSEADHSETENKEEAKEFNRPSELLSVDQKLKLHKLVQEYVDTTIKPFSKGILTNDQINDAYAGLYEFGAWILNR